MSSLPTRAELAVRYGDFERAEGRRDRISAALFMGALLGNIPLFRWVDRNPGTGWIAAMAFVLEFGGAIAFALRARARARDAGVSCPSCDAIFLSPAVRQLVIATGSCGKCAAPVARDGATAESSQAPEHLERTGSPWRFAVVVALFLVWLAFQLGMPAQLFARRRPADLPYVRANSAPVGVTVQEAATRIAARTGRPSIVILYSTRGPLIRRMFSDFAAMAYRHPEVDVLAFANDEERAAEVPPFLRKHRADFVPLYLRAWPPGQLDAALSPLGIRVGRRWTPPLVAVRDANNFIVLQGDGMTDVRSMERALERLREP